MKKQRTPVTAVPTPVVEVVPEREEREIEDLESNAAIQEEMGAGHASSDPPVDPFGDATSGAPDGLPFGDELQAAGIPTDGVEGYTDKPDEMDALGARAAAFGNQVVFAESNPDFETVAEEAIHANQFGGVAGQAGTAVSSPQSGAETEAKSGAAKAASEGSAGPIRQRAPAVIHRAETPAPATAPTKESEKKKGTTELIGPSPFLVFTDKDWPTAKPFAPKDPAATSEAPWIGRSAYAAKKREFENGESAKALVIQLVSILSADSEPWARVDYVKAAAMAFSAEVLALVFQDETFWSGVSMLDAKTLLGIAKVLDPVERLKRLLDDDMTAAELRTWSKTFPDFCERALQDGQVQEHLNDFPGQGVEERLWLMNHGAWRATPRDTCIIAVAKGGDSTGAFLVAFDELKAADPDGAHSLLMDALFLKTARENLTGFGFERILAEMSTMGIERAPQAGDLDAITRQKAEEQAKLIAPSFVAAVEAENGPTALSLASSYHSSALAIYKSVADAATAPEVKAAAIEGMSQVMQILVTAIDDEYDGWSSVAGWISRKLDAESGEKLCRLLRTEHQQVAEAFVAFSSDLTDEDKKRLEPKIGEWIQTSLTGFTGLGKSTKAFEGLLRSIMIWLHGTLTSEDPGQYEADWAAKERQRKAFLLFKERFAAKANLSFDKFIEMGAGQWGGMTLGSTIDVLGKETELADNPDLYSERITDQEQAALRSVYADWGKKFNSEFHENYTDDDDVLKLAKGLRTDVFSALKPKKTEGANLAVYEKKKVTAMVDFLSWYGGEYEGFAKELDDHCGNPEHDEVQRILYIRRDENLGVVAQELQSQGDQDADAQAAFLETFRSAVQNMAQELNRVLAPALRAPTKAYLIGYGIGPSIDIDFGGTVDDSDVLGICSRFSMLSAGYTSVFGDKRKQDATDFLVREFAAYGGRLQPAIRRGLSDENAKRAFSLLGLRGPSATLDIMSEFLDKGVVTERALQDEDKKSDDSEEFEHEMQSRVEGLSALFAAKGATSFFDPDPFISMSRIVATRARGYKDGLVRLADFWHRTTGITLAADIGLHIYKAEARQTIASLFGITAKMPWPSDYEMTWSKYTQHREDAERWDHAWKKGQGANEDIPEDLPKDMIPERGAVSANFTIEEAMGKASKIHRLISELPNSEDELLRTVAEGSNRAENKVIAAAYRHIYGFDFKYQLRQVYKDKPDEVDRLQEMAQSAGKLAFTMAMREHARNGDFSGAKKYAFNATPAEKATLAKDTETLSVLRNAFGQSKYEQIYRTVTDQISLYELQRANGGGIFGWFTDEEGTYEDTKGWFDSQRIKLMHDPALRKRATDKSGKLDPAQLKSIVKEKMKALAARTFADPNVQAMIEREFSGDEKFEMEATVLGQGTKGGDDTVVADLVGVGTKDSLWADMESMSDEEKKRRRDDPLFQAYLSSDMDNEKDGKRDQAFEELFADAGHNHEAKFEEHAQELKDDKEGRDARDAGERRDFNEASRAVFATLYAMSSADLLELRKDRVRVLELRAVLTEKESVVFDQYLSGTHEAIGDAAGTDDATGTKKKEQEEKLAIVQHSHRLLFAIGVGTPAILSAAQTVYCAKHEVEIEVPDPKNAGKTVKETVEAFGPAARAEVWKLIESRYISEVKHGGASIADGGRVYDAVFNAVMLPHDPSKDPAKLRFALGEEGFDNDGEMTTAVQNASPGLIASEWSNIKRRGPTGKVTSLKEKYDKFTAARIAAEAARAARAAGEGEGHSPEELEVLRSEEQAKMRVMMHDLQHFTEHPIDLSTTAMAIFGDGDQYAGKKDNNLRVEVRKKIMALTPGDVASALGVGKDDPAFATDSPLFMNDKRKAISDAAHRGEQVGRAVFDGGSIADGTTNADERVKSAYWMYLGEVSDGAAGYTDANGKWIIGDVSAEEKERIDDKGGDVDTALADLTEARAMFASILKWIAIAIITIVATALTGPGGPTLLAALLTGAATGVAKAGIDELVMGNDYDFMDEGIKTIVVDTLTSVATFGMGKAIKFAGGKFPIVEKAITKFEKFQKWEDSVAEGATQSFGGMAMNVAYQGGKSVVMAPLSAFTDAAVDSLDPSVWKYGTAAGMTHTGDVFDQKGDQMGDDLLLEFVTMLAKSTGSLALAKGKIALFGEAPDTSLLEGVDVGVNQAQDKYSLALDMAMTMKKVVSPGELASAMNDTIAADLAAKLMSGDLLRSSGWDDKELVEFLKSMAVGRADAAVTGAASAAQRWTHQNAKGDRMKDVRKEMAGLIADPAEAQRALAMYEHYLDAEATMSLGDQKLGVSFEEWHQTKYTKFMTKVDSFVDDAMGANKGDADERKKYKDWLLGKPGDTIKRMHSMSYAEFEDGQIGADLLIFHIKSSQEYKDLSPADRVFYDAYLDNPLQHIGDGGKAAVGLDIRADGGGEKFQTQVRNTRLTLVSNGASFITKDWNDEKRKAFYAYLRENPDQLAVVAPGNGTVNEVLGETMAMKFGATWDTRMSTGLIADGPNTDDGTPTVTIPVMPSLTDGKLPTPYDKAGYVSFKEAHPYSKMGTEEWYRHQWAKEEAFLGAFARELAADPSKLAQVQALLPGVSTGSIEELRVALKSFKHDAQFTSVAGGGGTERGFSLSGFRRGLLSNTPVPGGPLLYSDTKEQSSYGNDYVGIPNWRMYLAPLKEVEHLSPAEYSQQLGLVANGWEESAKKLNEYVATYGSEEGRKMWRAWVVSPEGRPITGGFKSIKIVHVVLDTDELRKSIRYAGPHLASDITEVTTPSQPLDKLDRALIDINLADDVPVGVSVRAAIKAHIAASDDPELAAQADAVDTLSAEELSRIIGKARPGA